MPTFRLANETKPLNWPPKSLYSKLAKPQASETNRHSESDSAYRSGIKSQALTAVGLFCGPRIGRENLVRKRLEQPNVAIVDLVPRYHSLKAL